MAEVEKYRIMFVCSGNTCRSPMAAAALSDMLPAKLRGGVQIESAGAFAAAGDPATPAAVAALERVGIKPGKHAARPLTAAMVHAADLILAMESVHRVAVLELDAGKQQDKVHLLHAFGMQEPRADEVVEDPYGGSPAHYEKCLARIRRHLERVVAYLEEQLTGLRPRR